MPALRTPAPADLFSYPITMPEGTKPVDIWSLHYAEYGHDPAEMEDNHSVGQQWGKRAPVLHDEYAHLPCYDLSEQRRDPAVREFWGESIKRFWESDRHHSGRPGRRHLGRHRRLHDHRQGCSAWEWGIIDGWRRQKPEYWLLKKAYSPIRIADAPLPMPVSGQVLRVPIANWFDHTNLQESGGPLGRGRGRGHRLRAGRGPPQRRRARVGRAELAGRRGAEPALLPPRGPACR